MTFPFIHYSITAALSVDTVLSGNSMFQGILGRLSFAIPNSPIYFQNDLESCE